MTAAVGIDVGGTKIAGVLVDAGGARVLARETVPLREAAAAGSAAAACAALAARLAGDRAPLPVGVGLPEYVDRGGHPTSAYTIAWDEDDAAVAFASLGAPLIESDVRAGAIAEGRLGAARGLAEPWAYVSVGTGISHALMLDGRPYEGARGNAIALGAPPVEQVASGPAIARAGRRASAEEAFADPACADVVAAAAAALGAALAWLAAALDPALIVIGGGLGLVDRYRHEAVRAMRPLIEHPATRAVPVRAAALGADAGAIGAALAAAGAAR